MKALNEYIKESLKVIKGNKFADEFSYSLEDWNKWKKEVNRMEDITVYEDTDNGLYLIYIGKGDRMKHIATYIVADEKMLCDDSKLFGN